MWFDSLDDLLRIVLVGAAAYVVLIVVLRMSGKRTLAQLNAFDFVVTVSFGSTLATILLSSEVSFSEGITALVLLAALQFLVAWLSVRWPGARGTLTAKPALLLSNGRVHQDALRRNRLTEAELRQAIRMQGTGDLSDVKAVVLETNGKISIISTAKYGSGNALEGISGTEDL
ncbi:DUF421 domain-containing protein [Arthrobacter sp. ATA002]|uniref:DUF421 domain-containing protein n=1 Tax=Arthrobacter sp. ATA002 TaxID=2991715 RepID=UPI0022A734A1|nr:YetF domain-containing protein [Arthrobacter sp. ATA002]WAP50691.1 DUF421 domain-containing protein [Arthrobacter sp. ATA002]